MGIAARPSRPRLGPLSAPRRLAIRSAALVALTFAALPSPSSASETGIPEGWVSFDGVTQTATAPALEIVSSDVSELVLRVTTPGVVTRTVEHEDTQYRELSFPGYYHTTEEGHPCLPAVRQLVAVPEGCEIQVSVSLGDSAVWTGTVVYPVEAAVVRYTEEGWPYIAYEFARDDDAYQTSGYYPREIAGVSSQGSLRGQGVALLTVYPIQYDAAASRTRAFPSISVTLRFSGGTGGLAEPLGPLGTIAQDVLLNYNGVVTRGRGSAGPGDHEVCTSVQACDELDADYLMIVEGSLMRSAWVDTLALHRATWNGWNVAIVPDTAVINNYEGANEISDEAIKEFIRDVYDTDQAEHMDDGRLGYILLVGDAKDTAQGGAHVLLPAHEQYGATTDHWYSCVDGEDAYADLMIGRLCAGDTTELRLEVTKYATYERTADSTDAWRDDVLLSCGFAWLNCPKHADDETSWVIYAHSSFDSTKATLPARYQPPSEIHAHLEPGSDCYGQFSEAAADNVDALNGGVFVAELAVHGYEKGCYTFSGLDVLELTNATSLPFWMSISCLTGAYDYCEGGTPVDCLGEQLLHGAGLNGAVAFFGATELSDSPALEYLTPYVWQAFFGQHLHSLGEAIAFAKLKALSVTGSTWDVSEYNLLGDPALNLFLTNSTGYGSKPDYVVSPSDIRTSPDFPSVSHPAFLQAFVHNKSNYNPEDPVAVRLELCERDGTGCGPADTVLVQPMAWSADTASVAWNIGPADVGQYLLKVTVDPGNEQSELFEDNNAAETFVGAYFERTGFPDTLGGAGAVSLTVANVDRDPELEILAPVRSPSRIVPCSYDGQTGNPFVTPGDAPIRGPVAVADLDGDGEQEAVVCYGDTVMALSADDLTPAWASPHYAKGLDASSASIADVNGGDGELEVLLQRSWRGFWAWDALEVLSADGSLAWRDSVYGSPREVSFPCQAPAVADLDADGRYEVARVFPAYIRAVRPETEALVWEASIGSVPPDVRPCSSILADVCPDSSGIEVLCGVEDLRCFSARGRPVWTYDTKGHLAGIAAADLDGDSELEVAASTYRTATEPGGATGWVYVINADGTLADSTRVEYGVTTGPVVADLDGNGDSEIIVGSSLLLGDAPPVFWVSHLDIFTFDPVSGLDPFFDRPLFFWGQLTSTPTIADADLDGQLEIDIVDGMGILHYLEYWDAGSLGFR